jgi:hypothetical protein
MDKRVQRLTDFNAMIKIKLRGTHIRSIDMCQYLVDSKGHVKSKFIDSSSVNVHFRWEPQIPFMLKEFKYYGLTDKFMGSIADLRAEELKYLAEKNEQLETQIGKKQLELKNNTVGSKILLHPNATSKVSLSHDNLRLGCTKTKRRQLKSVSKPRNTKKKI